MSYSLYQDLLTFNIASKCIEGWWALSRDGKFKRKVKRTGINFCWLWCLLVSPDCNWEVRICFIFIVWTSPADFSFAMRAHSYIMIPLRLSQCNLNKSRYHLTGVVGLNIELSCVLNQSLKKLCYNIIHFLILGSWVSSCGMSSSSPIGMWRCKLRMEEQRNDTIYI